MDEVKDGIYQLQHIYKENNMNTKFLFGVLSSRMLKCQFDIKEELNSLVHNNALIERVFGRIVKPIYKTFAMD